MTELIFLGVGAIIPTVAGDHTAFLLHHAGKTILFDAGPALEVQLDRVGVAPTEIDHVYLSHQHGDHTLGSPMLLFHHRSRRYLAAPPVLEAWRQLVEIVYPNYLALIPEQVVYHDLKVGVANPWPDLPDVTARLAPVDHSGLQAYALRLDFAPAAGPAFSLVYSGDTCPTASVVELARDADLLIHEATFSETLNQFGGSMHTSARQAGEIAQKAGVRTLALVHRLAGDREIWRKEAGEMFQGEVLVPLAGDRLKLPGTPGRITTRLIDFFTMQLSKDYHVYDSSTGYRLPNGDVRSPDVSIIAPGRLPGELDPIGFLEIPPDLAIEIISPSERYEDVIIKVHEYLNWGVKAVWVVEPATEEVIVYSADGIARFAGEDELRGGDAAPGFVCQVRDLFPG